MKTKIVLAIVPRIQDDFGYTPAGPALVKGAIVNAGFDCKIFDFNSDIDHRYQNNKELMVPIENWFMNYNFYSNKIFKIVEQLINDWANQILKYNPTHVGISIFSYNSQRATRMLSTVLKARNPNIKIFIGGAGLNTDDKFPTHCLNEKIIDCWIRGEGEKSVLEYLNGNTDYPGINGKPFIQIDNIEDLPFPDYSDYELKTYTNKKGLIALPITGSRGCVRHCTFCDVHSLWPKYRFRSGDSIANEIKSQVKRYKAKAFRFTDSLINGSMKTFRDMTSVLSKFRLNLPEEDRFTWDSHFIVRGEKQMLPQDFVKMAESGAGTLLVGVESGSPTVRKHMKKGYTNEELHYSLNEIFKNNIKVRFLMIIGYPTETQEDFQQTLDLFDRYKDFAKSGLIEEVNLGLTLNLLPNTPLYEDAEQFGLETTKTHINDWICTQNPELDFRERLKRRIHAQYYIEKLGYKVFESKNYTRALAIAWNQVNNMNRNMHQFLLDADKIKYDRDKGGMTEVPTFDPHRTY